MKWGAASAGRTLSRSTAGPAGGTVEIVMKFHATVVFEFNAPDVGEAGKRLNELLEQAQERQLETSSLELSTPQGTPVTLPPVAPVARP
jgi:hypothetical protein